MGRVRREVRRTIGGRRRRRGPSILIKVSFSGASLAVFCALYCLSVCLGGMVSLAGSRLKVLWEGSRIARRMVDKPQSRKAATSTL